MTTFSTIEILDIDLTPYMRVGQDTSSLRHKSWQANLKISNRSSDKVYELSDKLDELEGDDLENAPFVIDGQLRYGKIGIYEEGDEYIIIVNM